MAGTWDDDCMCLVHSAVPMPVRQARSRRSALSSHHHRSPPLAPPYHCRAVCPTISASMFSPLRMIANNSEPEPRHVAKTAVVRRHGRLSVRRRCSHGCRPPAPRPSVPPRSFGLLLTTTMGGTTPDTHGRPHGPHHQRWPSLQDQGVHGTSRRAP